jgi:putative ABC transport system permease protein
MIVFAGRTSLQAGGTRAGRQVQWEADDWITVLEQSPDCAYVMPELGGRAAVRSLYNNATLLVTGSLPEFADVRSIPAAEGHYPNWNDEKEAPGGFQRRQEAPATARPWARRSASASPAPSFGVRTHRSRTAATTARHRHVFVPSPPCHFNSSPARPNSVDRLTRCRSRWLSTRTASEVRQSLARLHDFDPRTRRRPGSGHGVEAQAFRSMTDGMKYFPGAWGWPPSFIGGIGVMNVMLVAVRERTREIGVRKAVGATRRSIIRQFFVETMIVVFLSGGSGMAIAYGICALVNLLPMPQFFAGLLPTWQSGTLAFLLLGTVAVLSALYPASRAAAVDPIEALRTEGGLAVPLSPGTRAPQPAAQHPHDARHRGASRG